MRVKANSTTNVFERLEGHTISILIFLFKSEAHRPFGAPRMIHCETYLSSDGM